MGAEKLGQNYTFHSSDKIRHMWVLGVKNDYHFVQP